jgi:Nucleoside-diphosphate-sugar epimerases
MNNQTVLVTGGTGFLDVNTILELLKQGFTVRTTLRTLSRTGEEAIIASVDSYNFSNTQN